MATPLLKAHSTSAEGVAGKNTILVMKAVPMPKHSAAQAIQYGQARQGGKITTAKSKAGAKPAKLNDSESQHWWDGKKSERASISRHKGKV